MLFNRLWSALYKEKFNKHLVPKLDTNKPIGTTLTYKGGENLDQYVGKHVKLSKKHIKNWVFSNENWDGTRCPNPDNQDYADIEYDQEILLALFMLMKEPVYGVVKATGHECLLCYFTHAGCQQWTYVEPKDLVFLD